MTTIIAIGNFWIYDAPKKQVKLERISTRVCHHAGIALHLSDYRFIDGNHGNSDYLTPDASDPVTISKHITHMPREPPRPDCRGGTPVLRWGQQH